MATSCSVVTKQKTVIDVATRRIPSRSSQTLAAATPLTITTPPIQSTTTFNNTLDLSDGEKLFASVPTRTLLTSLANLYLMAMEPAVDLGMAVMKSRVVEREGLVRKMVMLGMKKTVYGHFCAGENIVEASKTLQKLWEEGLGGILDYGLEDAEENVACDKNLVEFLRTVEMTTHLPPNSVSFACVKITAICPIALLERVSNLLRWEQLDPTLRLPWKLPSLPVLTQSSPLYHTSTPPPPLTASEERDLSLAYTRLSTLTRRCSDISLPLLVDAEYTSVQPAIDYLTYSAMLEYNKTNPIVYGTVQAYLRDSMERLVAATEAAEKVGVKVGFKLVRGAYMSRETKLAESLGANSPIHATIGETHACYDRCTAFMLEKAAKGSGSVVLATHNLQSGKAAAAKAEELGVDKTDKKLQFAQLKGMAEGLSLGLKSAGFNVSKYLAFGPVGKVIPYLLRRAEENRGLLSASTLDRDLMRTELKRRLKAAMFGRV